MANFCTECGKPINECICKSNNSILDMFPNEIKPCEGEVKVRAYHCAQLQSKFLRTTKAVGVLTITNRRVIFRTKGIRNDKNFEHSEVAIEDVSGVTLKKGRFFDLVKLFIVYFVGSFIVGLIFTLPTLIATFIATIIGGIFKLKFNEIAITISVLNILIYVGIIALLIWWAVKRHQKLKELGVKSQNNIKGILIFGIWYFLNPVRPALTLKIISKGGEQGSINITLDKKFGFIDLSAEPVSTDEAADMMKEVGAVISDIQKMGDFGIQKWQKN